MKPQDISDQILNEIEKDKISTFVKDPVLFHAVKKYVLAVAYAQGTFEKGKPFNGTLNYALNFSAQSIDKNQMPRSDEELGQNLRALTYATSLVESGFKELAEIPEVEPLPENKDNPAE